MTRDKWTEEEKKYCDSRSGCMGCKYVEDSGYFLECGLENKYKNKED